MSKHPPWIRSARFDTIFILLPPFAITLLVAALPGIFQTGARNIPGWAWVVFVLCVDVAHVYGTLFRTYFAPSRARHALGAKLVIIPFAAWLGGVAIYSFGAEYFWRTLAYLAVFHFVRQAYGFMRIYSRQDRLGPWERRFSAAAIYAATLFPLVYWHLHLPRRFSWLMDGDFVGITAFLGHAASSVLERTALALYVFAMGGYAAVELRRWWLGNDANLARIAIVSGTALSWFTGIIVYDGDLAFTATNVVAHGLPYMGLTWAYWRAQHQAPDAAMPVESRVEARGSSLLAKIPPFAIFALALVLLAYLEEGLWNGLIWQDHPRVFAWTRAMPIVTSDGFLVWLVPLLALPQSTHYLLDAFVWKLRSRGSEWKSTLSPLTVSPSPTLSDDSSFSTSKAAIRNA